MTRLISWEEHGEPIGTRLDDPQRPDRVAEKAGTEAFAHRGARLRWTSANA